MKALLLACCALLPLTAAAEKLAAVQHLRQGNGNEPETLDPHRSEGVSSANIVRDLYEGLTLISPKGTVVPGSASHWAVSADGITYTFHLRPEARWSNGDALTAADFVAGLQRSADPATGSAYSQILSPLANADAILARKLPVSALGATALDAHTLQLRLKAPTPYLLGLLTHASTFPIHRPSLAKWGKDFARKGRLVGNGAYALADWREQAFVRLVRNPHYWNNAATVIEQVEYLPTEDINSELARYRADELDTTYEIPLLRAPWIKASFGQQLHIAPYLGTYFYGFNCQRPPFKDNPKLRAALTLAVDRDVVVSKVMNGVAIPAYSFVPPGIWNYTPQVPEWASWPREKRLAEARRLYAEAGYSASNPLKFEFRYNTNDGHRRIAIVIAAMWKQWLGVETTLVNEEFKVFIANRNLRKVTEAFRSGWIADYDDATGFTDILHSTHGQNDSGWNSPAYDALVAKAAHEPDAAKRRAILEEAERLVMSEFPVLPIYTYVSKHLVKPWVRGWQDNALDYHYSKDLRLLAH